MNIQFWLIILAALTPAVILLIYILIKDRHHPEPFKQIAKGFGFGGISILLVLIVVGIPDQLGLFHFNAPTVLNAINQAFLMAAFPEEAAKMLMLWLLLRKNPFFDEHMDGIVYAVCVGMGFAATENIMYLFSNIDEWQTVAFGRAFLSIPEHFCVAVIMGYFFAIAFFNPTKRWCYALAYLVPVLLHGVYDACLMINSIPFIGMSSVVNLLFLGSFIFAIWYSKKAIKKHLSTDYTPQPVDTKDAILPQELDPLAEAIAKNVHDVWSAGRIADGWTYGKERNDALKQHPCLIPYEDLSEEEKEYDRRTSQETLKLIMKQGFKIVKETKD